MFPFLLKSMSPSCSNRLLGIRRFGFIPYHASQPATTQKAVEIDQRSNERHMERYWLT